MKKHSFIFLFLYALLPVNAISDSARTLPGQVNEKTAEASILEMVTGPDIPEIEFHKLALPKMYYGAYYRYTYGQEEIYPYIIVDLIGIWEENDTKVIESYIVPLNDYFGEFLKGQLVFKGWKSYNSFEIDTKPKVTNTIKVTVSMGGRFKIQQSK